MADRFVIGPTGGLENDLKPFMIADEAMASLRNAYPFRGRLRKRFGSDYMGDNQLTSRLRAIVTTTDGAGTASGTVPGTQFNVGQMFSIGTNLYTVQALGAPVDMLVFGIASTARFNTTTGAFVFTGVPALTDVYWYPALPVMGLMEFDLTDFELQVPIAFDTQFAYQFTSGWQRLSAEADVGAATWTGSNSDFFWGTMWTGPSAADRLLYVTNFNELEPNFMRFYSSVDSKWHNFKPRVQDFNGTKVPKVLQVDLISARILVVFKNRLLAFNTWEILTDLTNPMIPVVTGPFNYTNRVRWSQANADPSSTEAWQQDIPGKGNGLDAPTTQAVITVEFVKDRLVVYFEESTYELVYTGNQVYPFNWQKINTELGAESTFSIVPFDKVALGIGNVGIHACNGSNVERIDNLIPNEVFDIHTSNDGIKRVAGIREYKTEMVYWTLPDPSASNDQPYPNTLLLYNYKSGGWAFVDDSFTAFGYFYQQFGITWDSTVVTWDDSVSWNDGALAAQFRQVIAGNQEGYVTILDPDENTNAGALQATNITNSAGQVLVTCIDHNLRIGEYIAFPWVVDSVTGKILTTINGLTATTGDLTMPPIWKVVTVIDGNNFNIVYTGTPVGNPILDSIALGNTYTGGTTISRVSQIDIVTKAFNFYAKKGMNASINNIDFLVDNSGTGEITLDWYTSTNLNSQRTSAQLTGTLLGNNVLSTRPYALYPFEAEQQQLWHRSYVQANGMYIQLELSFQNEQMIDPFKSGVNFQLHQIVFNAQPTASRLQ